MPREEQSGFDGPQGGHRPLDVPRIRHKQFRILHLASGDLWGGAEAMILDLATAQQDLGHDVTVALFNDGLLAERLAAGGIATRVFPEAASGPLGLLRSVHGLCRALGPDVLHSHRIKETVIGAAAARLAGVPACVRTVHGDNEHVLAWHQLRKGLARLAERLASAALVSATVAVSGELCDRLQDRWPSGRVVTIENGVNVARIRRQASEADDVPPRRKGCYRIGVVGRLVPVKRVDLFLDACDALARRSGRAIEAVIIGDGPLRTDLERHAAARAGVAFTFAGFVDNPAAWIRSLDLLAITSDHEGLPMCLLEAFALDVPVVARAVGGIPALLADGTRGRLVPAGDAESLASAMLAVLDSTEADAFARAANPFPAELTIETTARRYVDLYAQSAASGGVSPPMGST